MPQYGNTLTASANSQYQLISIPADPGSVSIVTAKLGAPLAANDRRQDYIRATLARDAAGALTVTPFPVQDSSMVSVLARADALIVRKPSDPAANAGDLVEILPLGGGAAGI